MALNPDIQVYVHEIGARHMIDPSRLLASAERIYGALMDRLWGPFLPVSAQNVHILSGDETLKIGGRSLQVAYTPGHAKHHVSYLDIETGTAYVGDVAGMQVHGVNFVVPVTPPPDVDLERWYESLNTIWAWNPRRLFVTHFGPSDDVPGHLNQMEHRLGLWAEQARILLNEEGSDADRSTRFHEAAMADTYRKVPAEFHAPYEHMGQPSASWYGLARYWRKKAEQEQREI
jgi:glyoxylase-like metal-dependent hydrolase (beta-lactamase superfamily II)